MGYRAGAPGSPEFGFIDATTMIRGANLTVKPGYANGAGNVTNRPWSDLWQEWDWAGWLKWQIDLAHGIGANAIRLQSAVGGIARGQLTRSDHEAKLRQIIEYVGSLGMGYYATGAGEYSTPRTNATRDELIHMGSVVSEYDHVIAFELFQEWDYWIQTVPIAMADMVVILNGWYQAVKASGCTKPLGYSVVSPWNALEVHHCTDYYDMHCYTGPTFDWRSYTHRKDVLIAGEYGGELADTNRVARYEGVRTFLKQYTNFYGAFAWAVVDQGTTTERYGLFDNTPTRRTDVETAWNGMPTHRSQFPYPKA